MKVAKAKEQVRGKQPKFKQRRQRSAPGGSACWRHHRCPTRGCVPKAIGVWDGRSMRSAELALVPHRRNPSLDGRRANVSGDAGGQVEMRSGCLESPGLQLDEAKVAVPRKTTPDRPAPHATGPVHVRTTAAPCRDHHG